MIRRSVRFAASDGREFRARRLSMLAPEYSLEAPQVDPWQFSFPSGPHQSRVCAIFSSMLVFGVALASGLLQTRLAQENQERRPMDVGGKGCGEACED